MEDIDNGMWERVVMWIIERMNVNVSEGGEEKGTRINITSYVSI